MQRNELIELQYITPIANLPSILRLGILSHNEANRVAHQSVAMSEIQDRRARVTVPGGRKLHEYANLYICARNPMMFKLQAMYQELCVIKVNPDVIDLPEVIICDRNASSEYAIFKAAPNGLEIVNTEWTFAEYWTDSDQITEWMKKAAKCAEVLVPNRVPSAYITGFYVACQEARTTLKDLVENVIVEIDRCLFFR